MIPYKGVTCQWYGYGKMPTAYLLWQSFVMLWKLSNFITGLQLKILYMDWLRDLDTDLSVHAVMTNRFDSFLWCSSFLQKMQINLWLRNHFILARRCDIKIHRLYLHFQLWRIERRIFFTHNHTSEFQDSNSCLSTRITFNIMLLQSYIYGSTFNEIIINKVVMAF